MYVDCYVFFVLCDIFICGMIFMCGRIANAHAFCYSITDKNAEIYWQEYGGHMCSSSAVVGPLCYEHFFVIWCQFDTG
jgi:hypothetical protein